jgi:hypothetical protein
MTTVKDTKVYVNTKRVPESNSIKIKGDDFQTMLGGPTLVKCQGEKIKMTLKEFTMQKTWTGVNVNNNMACLTARFAAGGGTTITVLNPTGNELIAPKNYASVRDVAIGFKNAMGNQFLNAALTAYAPVVGADGFQEVPGTLLTPLAGAGISGSSDNIISFTLELTLAGAPVSPSLEATPLNVKMYEIDGDSAKLLGGDRIIGDKPTTSPVAGNVTSITVSRVTGSVGTNAIKFECLYPALRYTTPNLYLRSNIIGKSLESPGFKYQTTNNDSNRIIDSNILAIIPANTETCYYLGNTYNYTVINKDVDTIILSVTDERGRKIGRLPNSLSNTAAGTGLSQSTLGNLHFSCSLHFEVFNEPVNYDKCIPHLIGGK